MKKALYKFHADCGRAGKLYGLFIAENQFVDKLIEDEMQVYFGEVLGKHSEIVGSVSKEDITLVTDDEFILDSVIKLDLIFGYNPFEQELGGDEAIPIGFEGETVGDLIEFKLNNGL